MVICVVHWVTAYGSSTPKEANNNITTTWKGPHVLSIRQAHFQGLHRFTVETLNLSVSATVLQQSSTAALSNIGATSHMLLFKFKF